MEEPDAGPSAESVLRAAPPHALVTTAETLLKQRVGAQSVTVLLADYGATVLQPVRDLPYAGEAVSAYDGPAGRAFSTQTPVLEPSGELVSMVAHLPITVRGDRLGVLSVRLPEDVEASGTIGELVDFASALGHELPAAERDTDLYLQARRRKRLTLAAEMQWQLLPGRGCAREEYDLAAHLEPAYSVGGDNFDWSTGADHLTVTVTDGMGHGIDASLLTGLTVNALRNARRAGLGLADQARLADQAVYAQYGGKVYASTLLLRIDLGTGLVEAVDAGSPQLFRLRAGVAEHVELEAQLPLGMFEETEYVEQSFALEPGDRLTIVSSGVHAMTSADGRLYGERALRQALSATRLASPHEVARAVVQGLVEHHGGKDLPSDAAVVCLDWRGRTTA